MKNPSGEGIREFYGDPIVDGSGTSLEDSYQAILDVINRPRSPNADAAVREFL